MCTNAVKGAKTPSQTCFSCPDCKISLHLYSHRMYFLIK